MRITDVECILLRGDETYGTRRSETDATDQGDWLALIRVETDEGLVGWSEVETLTTAAPSIVQGVSMGPPGFHTLRDILVGEDPEDIERLWNKMFVGTAYYGRRGIALHCMSAVDNCLWSIKAQAAAAPLSELLGGRRRGALPAYASSLFWDDPEDNYRAARKFVEAGYRAAKFGWGPFGEDPGRDVEILAAIREALGPGRDLMVDPGWYGIGWSDGLRFRTRRENLELCERVAPFNPVWVEDFIHPEYVEDYAYVRERSPVPVAAGEQLTTIWDFERYLDSGCVDILQPDLTRCGGLTVATRVAAMAAERGIDVITHSWISDLLHAYSVHFMSTLPGGRYVEFNAAQSRLSRGVTGGTMTLTEDGTLPVPDAPGLGVSVDIGFVEHHRVN